MNCANIADGDVYIIKNMEDKEKQAMQLLDECCKCINEGNTDSFRSYEEGVKDALEWVYCKGQKPLILEEE